MISKTKNTYFRMKEYLRSKESLVADVNVKGLLGNVVDT